MVREMVLGCFFLTEAGEQQIGWVPEKDQAVMDAVGKACDLPSFHAKIAKCQKYGRQVYQDHNIYNL